MFQLFPHHSLLIEGLRVSSATVVEEGNRTTHVYGDRRVVLLTHPNAFDANHRAIVGPFVQVTGTSRGKRIRIDI